MSITEHAEQYVEAINTNGRDAHPVTNIPSYMIMRSMYRLYGSENATTAIKHAMRCYTLKTRAAVARQQGIDMGLPDDEDTLLTHAPNYMSCLVSYNSFRKFNIDLSD